MSDKFPYSMLTPHELAEAEEHFLLIMGGDAVCIDGCYSFTKSEVEKLYKDTFHDLHEMYVEGLTDQDKATALDLMAELYICPVRVH